MFPGKFASVHKITGGGEPTRDDVCVLSVTERQVSVDSSVPFIQNYCPYKIIYVSNHFASLAGCVNH